MAAAATTTTTTGDGLTANLSLATSVSIFGYVAVAVLKQSDAELILPSSTFDLGGLLDKFKDGVPGGAFVAPILQVKLPLYLFYTVGPLLLLTLHACIVSQPKLLRDAVRPLRWAALWLPPCSIALIVWRFSSYVAARPDPPLLGVAMEALQWLALAADFALVIFALIYALDERPPDTPGASARCAAAMLRAARYAGLILLAGLMPSGLVAVMWPVAAALLVVWLYEGWFVRAQTRTIVERPWYRPLFIKEDVDMQGRVLIASVFLGLTVLPALGRGLDLSGESLVARAPTETMMAAFIVAQGPAKDAKGLAIARQQAWTAYGRGINLDKWRFEHARFDRAEMAYIRLREAKLGSASLDNSNLIEADLTSADLSGASLRNSDMRNVMANGTRLAVANVQVAQNTGEQKPAATGPKPPEDICKNVKPEDRTNFSRADFSGTDLTDADLRCTILRGVKMDSGTTLTGTKLEGANLCGATLNGVDLSGVVGARGAILAHSDLSRATLPQDISWSLLKGAYTTGAKFKSEDPPPNVTYAKAMEIKFLGLEPNKAPPDVTARMSLCNEPGDPGNIRK